MTKREAKIKALTHVAMFADAHANDAETENGPKVADGLRQLAKSNVATDQQAGAQRQSSDRAGKNHE